MVFLFQLPAPGQHSKWTSDSYNSTQKCRSFLPRHTYLSRSKQSPQLSRTETINQSPANNKQQKSSHTPKTLPNTPTNQQTTLTALSICIRCTQTPEKKNNAHTRVSTRNRQPSTGRYSEANSSSMIALDEDPLPELISKQTKHHP